MFETADREVVRLSPTAFPELPGKLSLVLQQRGCTIPQVSMLERHNVSSILIFWNGSEINPGRIAEAKDIDLLQSARDNKIIYSRSITPVGKAYIMEHYTAYGGPKPPPIDHQGINDAFVEKASVVLYFYQGKWLKLTGAD